MQLLVMSWIAWAITTVIMGWIIIGLKKQNDAFADRLMCKNYGEYLLARQEQNEITNAPNEEQEEPTPTWRRYG